MSVEEAIDTQLAVAILDRMREELKQLPEGELLQQNVDAVTAIIKARRTLSKLARLEPLVQQLPLFNLDNLERLEDFAMAFVGAQTQYEALRERNKEPAAVVADGIALRNQLLIDTRALVRRGVVAAEPLEKLRGGRGYKQVASDLLLLAGLLGKHVRAAAGKCTTSEEEVVRAGALADRIIAVVPQRRVPLKAVAEALEHRKRAFTQFSRAYSQVRRAVQYLRYDAGDAEQIAPPLTGTPKKPKTKALKRVRGKARSKKTISQGVVPDAERSSEAVVQATAIAVTPNDKTTAKPVTSDPSDRMGVGLPGSDPFMN